jgi:ABC-type glycerol-3-phosphate transport system substrate-binding protein
MMNTKWTMTRRAALKTVAAGAALPMFNIAGAAAATTLRMALWDHWVPSANPVMAKQIEDWAKQNHVTVAADFMSDSGNKVQLTAAAEAQAGAGHDIMTFASWDAHNYADKLQNVDDVIQKLEAKAGPFNAMSVYLGKGKNGWAAVPTDWGTLAQPSCARISMMKEFADVDVTQLYPAHPVKEAGKGWTWEGDFLKAAKAAAQHDKRFAIGLGQTHDSVEWVGALFASFGAQLVGADGKSRASSKNVHDALEYAKELVQYFPPETVSYDDASNNRALISGKSALIFNAPSAWAVAKKNAPEVAADCWVFPNPAGPKGRYIPYRGYFWGIWKFSKNAQPAKELMEYLLQRNMIEAREPASAGYDLPPQNSMMDFKIWSEVEPPKGVVYNYPLRPWFDAEFDVAGSPAPPEIAVQVYNSGVGPTMLAKLKGGASVKDVVSWANSRIEGFLSP